MQTGGAGGLRRQLQGAPGICGLGKSKSGCLMLVTAFTFFAMFLRVLKK